VQIDKIRCAVYARVSTEQQGDSLENQVGQCREFIARLGDYYDTTDIVIYKDEAVSGYYTSVFDRTAMKQAIQDAKGGVFQLLVFKEVSRVGRDKQENPAIIGMFEQYGARVIAINDNYDSLNKDNITFDILSVLSEQESKKISARVSSARKQKARRGQWNGEAPIGYKVDKETKKLIVDPETKHIPQLIFDLYVNGGLGTFKVAEHLNRQGITTRNNNRWSRESVNKILRNPVYIGSVVYGTRRNQLKREYDDSGKMSKRKVQIKLERSAWQVVEAAHEALVAEDIFRMAENILAAKGRRMVSKRASHPLTGILFCGQCGEGMVCQKRSYNNKDYRYYICKTYHKYGRTACSQANINADRLEEIILTACRGKLLLFPCDHINVSINREKDKLRMEQGLQVLHEKIKRLSQDQVDIFRQRELFVEKLYKEQMLTIKGQMEAAEADISKLKKQLEALNSEDLDDAAVQQWIEQFIKLDIRNLAMTRVLFQELIEHIRLNENELIIQYGYDFAN
jgi:site-specific DNA recombinase